MLIFHSIKEFYNTLKQINNLSAETKYVIQSSLQNCKSCKQKQQIINKVDIVTVQLFPKIVSAQDLNIIKSCLNTDKICVKYLGKILINF